MKKIAAFLFFALSLPLFLMAHPELDEPFDEIRVTGKIRLVLQTGDAPTVDIPADEDKVVVEVREGVLVVKRRERWKYSSYKKSVKVVVTYQEKLRRISADAGAEVIADEVLYSADALRLDFGSGATADLEVRTDDLEASAGEGAFLELAGATEELMVRAHTGGVVEAFDLQAERVYARANTGGQVELTANESLEATAHTGGEIDFRGNPNKLSISDELGGSVHGDGL